MGKEKGEKLTPMLKQYRDIKARYPDAIVLFRLGDFYEMFDEDARRISRELGLTLTSRSFSKHVRLPMCGFPHHQLTPYLGRLLARGHKVAVVEQLEDARKVKRLVRRDVVRVITPGTVVEDALLRAKTQNFLAALVRETIPQRQGTPQHAFGLALMDLSTGEFLTTEFRGETAQEDLFEELARLTPSEFVLPTPLAQDEDLVDRLRDMGSSRVSPHEATAFRLEDAEQTLRAHFRVSTLEGFGCAHMPLAIRAAGGLLHYLRTGQISDLAHITELTTYHREHHMVLDSSTQRNLELVEPLRRDNREGTLFATLDETRTAMGARLLRRWILQPLLRVDAIQARQDAVENFVQDTFLREDVRTLLDGVYDVERLVGRVGFGTANARDLVALRKSLARLPQLKATLERAQAPRLRTLWETLDLCADVVDLLQRALVENPPILVREGGLIREGFHQELDALRARARESKEWLAQLEIRERERTGIPNLRVRYNQVFGFFIEVPKSKSHLVPEEYERRATTTHTERYISPELKAKEAEILATEDRIKELEYDLFTRVRGHVAAQAARLRGVARLLAELDVLSTLAHVAAERNYVRPRVDESGRIHIREGRHPVVERLLPPEEPFVPNDVDMDQEERRLLIVTGPNMAGKSVFIRQVALITLMAHMGSFVPAREAHIGLVDRIFARVGASDDIAHGRSTFLVEMSETAHILRHATARSLIVLDEVGRGTSTYDGISIAWAVAEDLHDIIQARTLFATHYHELTRLAEHLPAVANVTLAVVERGHEVVFLRQVVPGVAEKSFGVHVARMAGLPERIVRRAEALLARLEQEPRTPLLRREVAEERADYRVAVAKSPARQEAGRAEDNGSSPSPNGQPHLLRRVAETILQQDLVNTTPLEALILLHQLQKELRGD
ncbi:MAG: DNA mismatch repair protein MutS [Chloroflexi bacterium]|nr:DNA mismatch repair protein MutS [Chloroflexota bacterium]